MANLVALSKNVCVFLLFFLCLGQDGEERTDICQCLPPDEAWNKVKSPKAD